MICLLFVQLASPWPWTVATLLCVPHSVSLFWHFGWLQDHLDPKSSPVTFTLSFSLRLRSTPLFTLTAPVTNSFEIFPNFGKTREGTCSLKKFSQNQRAIRIFKQLFFPKHVSFSFSMKQYILIINRHRIQEHTPPKGGLKDISNSSKRVEKSWVSGIT